ncbi:caspase family protein [Actinoplanes sp. NPDC051851]|uniref:caspase family protein n=1 Tax=Actinoplanes sp. NPDC051851 TaxID=3154753 RepID=UPI00344A225D
MTATPPAARSRAVLVGCGTYRHLTDLPGVANNLTDLAAALTDPGLWGLPPGNCAVVTGDTSVGGVIGAVRTAARDVGPDGLLLIYYAGHGLVDSTDGRLHLAVTESELGEEDATAVAYESIRRRVWQSRAAHKLVILDCCYAARALVGEMSAADLAEDVEIDQSVIIAATSRNLVALAPPGERNTAFSGALLTVLRDGVAGGAPVLDARTIYREILRNQAAKGLPRPEFRSRNAAEDLPLVRNAWQPPPAPPTRRTPPAPPTPPVRSTPPAPPPGGRRVSRLRLVLAALCVTLLMAGAGTAGAVFAADAWDRRAPSTPTETSPAPAPTTTSPSPSPSPPPSVTPSVTTTSPRVMYRNCLGGVMVQALAGLCIVNDPCCPPD